ncbi:MAG: hypothetical protein ACRDHG_06030 [Anaerolineales bacterium]
MATNSERRTPFDLRTTIPLAKATLISLARKPKRSWLIPFLTLITGVTFATMMLELMFSPGPLSALAFEGELRSKLVADYGADPLGAKIHELRLTIMNEVLGGGSDQSGGQVATDPELNDPVPTATPADQLEQTPTTEAPTAIALTATGTPMVAPTATASTTPIPTAVPATPAGSNCSKLSIIAMWIDGDDKLRADVRNTASVKAFLTDTTVEWPNVPPPAYVDWFEFDGNRYYNGDDSSSPTSMGGTSRQLSAGKTRTWEADWDDEPGEGIYGSFGLTLVFNISGEFCTLSSSTFTAPPATPVPSPGPSPSPLPATATGPAPTGTPVLTVTPASTPTPPGTPPPTPTPGT